jgi:hypothetical protein
MTERKQRHNESKSSNTNNIMRNLNQLASIAFLFGGMTMCAQVYSPDSLIGHGPKPPTHSVPKPIDDLQWLWQYAQPAPIGRANDLRVDQHFQDLLSRDFKQTQSMWGAEGSHLPLQTVIPLFLTKYGAVSAEQNRYFVVDGCVPSFCPAAGLLWIDLGTAHPLAIFAAVNWSTVVHTTDEADADYNLWLFSSRNLDPNALPLALTEAIGHWDARLAAAHRLVPHISHALLVEPDGSPYALDPQLVGANSIAPQPDTVTPHDTDEK